LTTVEAPKSRFATRNDRAPSCQLSPATKNRSAANAAPDQAKPASRSFFRAVRSASAPTTGRTSAESSVEAVITNDGSAPGATERPSTSIRSSTAASFATSMRYGAKSTPAIVVANAELAQS
jgi:hypothetical protein